MDDQKSAILEHIESVEYEAEPLSNSRFATENECRLAKMILELTGAMRVMIGAPPRKED